MESYETAWTILAMFIPIGVVLLFTMAMQSRADRRMRKFYVECYIRSMENGKQKDRDYADVIDHVQKIFASNEVVSDKWDRAHPYHERHALLTLHHRKMDEYIAFVKKNEGV